MDNVEGNKDDKDEDKGESDDKDAEMATPLCLRGEVLAVEPALSPCTLCPSRGRSSLPALGRQWEDPSCSSTSAVPMLLWEVFPLRLPLATEVFQHELDMVL